MSGGESHDPDHNRSAGHLGPEPAVDLRLAVGEYLTVPERLIVAPMPGRFEPADVDGGRVEAGQTVGAVVRSGDRVDVLSQVSGRFMGHLVDRGERVRDGQALAWVRLAG